MYKARWVGMCAALLMVTASSSFAVSIGLNFVGGRSGGGGGGTGGGDGNLVTGVAGVVPQGNWNNGLGSNAGPLALIDSNGAATGASATWGGVPNSWTVSGSAAADADAQLMNGYLDTNTTSTTTVNISNVPYSSYKVILYYDGDGTGRSGNYAVNGLPQSAAVLLDSANFPIGGPAPTSASFDDATVDGVGNFAVFRTVGSSLSVTATVPPDGNFRAPLNGIQIIALPEPASALLGLLGLAALGLRRRRRAA